MCAEEAKHASHVQGPAGFNSQHCKKTKLNVKPELPVSPFSGVSCPVLLELRLVDSGLVARTNIFHFPLLDIILRIPS
jgi:hypothetical protein